MLTALGLALPLLVLGGLVAIVVAAFRGVTKAADDEDTPVDAADIARSGAIHLGLFAALIAGAVGLIDLLQAFVEGDRVVGSNPDIARGLSLLIVATPVYALLMRTVDARHRERARAGDGRPHRGWSTYLVLALTTTLVAGLTSVAQITVRITDEFDQYRPEELMQLLVWSGLWLVHWFGLRPRHGIRGDAHLALGSVIGLGWLMTGVGAVVFRILDAAYRSAFDDSLAGSFDTRLWVVIAVAGGAVWAWHWFGHLNRPGRVEGDRRRSTLWYLTVVVAGVLPGLIAMLVSATAMVSGVAIWFIGSTDQDAADFFEPASIFITVLLLGLVVWAYHRFELDRRGVPVRNEPLRFHDYVVLFAALVGVVGSAAVVIGQLFEVAAAGRPIAGSLGVTNILIVAVTVLLAAAAVWWEQWAEVERHRGADPVAESDSIWRKLYLLAAFGVGGLVLSVSTVWVLFLVLRDLLDTQASHDTLQDLEGPAGWGIAVLGAVWYHLGVWRVDREVLATVDRHGPVPAAASTVGPPPPMAVPVEPSDAGAAPALTVRPALAVDLGELFTLRRATSVHDAILVGAMSRPGPDETLAELQDRLAVSATTVATRGTRIVGALIRGSGSDPEEELLVAPDQDRDIVEAALRTPAG